MKKINVCSPVYKCTGVNFNGFIANFNEKGQAVIEIEDNQVEALEEVFKIHPNIFKGTIVPEQAKVEVKEEQNIAQNNESNLNDELQEKNEQIKSLMESNKNLALENISLKKDNETLKSENEVLKKEKEELEQKIASFEENKEEENKEGEGSEEQNNEGEGEGENINKEEENKEQKEGSENSLIKELESKTVVELKALLNKELGDFKEEWKKLTKKEDIIRFICAKAEA